MPKPCQMIQKPGSIDQCMRLGQVDWCFWFFWFFQIWEELCIQKYGLTVKCVSFGCWFCLPLPQRGGGGRAERIEPSIAVPLPDTHGQFDVSDGPIGDVGMFRTSSNHPLFAMAARATFAKSATLASFCATNGMEKCHAPFSAESRVDCSTGARPCQREAR
jgi:hypothetical protein